MTSDFETDPYPGRPKILFIGFGGSTHTQAWINLLVNARLNVRLFAVPGGGIPPGDWNIRTYCSEPSYLLPGKFDADYRLSFYPLAGEVNTLEHDLNARINFKMLLAAKKALNSFGKALDVPTLYYDYETYDRNRIRKSRGIQAANPEEWLAEIIQTWKPDIVHTLGLFNGQGGEYYFDVRKRFHLEEIGKWILQLRGGSDLALNHLIPEMSKRVEKILRECHQIISDNTQNVQYLRELNIGNEQLSPLIPVPGTGGIDVAYLASLRTKQTSQSREIVFPKGYELMWSKCLPVFEAFRICWDRIAPCRIHILNTTPEVIAWFYALPAYIRECCTIHDRIPRRDFFSILANARVLLIPSLVDGVPNSLYEAMALGALPIVSPLEAIRSVVEDGKNVLFARNLFPQEIADTLTRAMTDNILVDQAVQNNLELVKRLADRSVIGERVVAYYESLA